MLQLCQEGDLGQSLSTKPTSTCERVSIAGRLVCGIRLRQGTPGVQHSTGCAERAVSSTSFLRRVHGLVTQSMSCSCVKEVCMLTLHSPSKTMISSTFSLKPTVDLRLSPCLQREEDLCIERGEGFCIQTSWRTCARSIIACLTASNGVVKSSQSLRCQGSGERTMLLAALWKHKGSPQ